MKNLKKLGLALVIGVLASCSQSQTQAQIRGDRTPSERAQLQTKMMTQALSLSKEQVPTVKKINVKYSEKIAAIQAQDGSRRNKFQRMRGLMEEKDQELATVLTEDQYEAYLKKKAEMHSKMKEKRKERSSS